MNKLNFAGSNLKQWNIFFKTLFFIFIMTLSYDNIYSQHSSSSKKTNIIKEVEDTNSLQKGKWSIQFAIDQNFTLTNFEGSTLSVKKHFSKHTALRLGFRGSYNKFENDTNNLINFKNSSIGFNLIFMYYLNPTAEINIYGYAGGEYTYLIDQSRGPSTFDRNVSWRAGPLVGAGAEFFIFKKLSVFAEYSYSFGFGEVKNYTKRLEPPFEEYRSDYNIISLNPNAVKFGLSVYF